MLKKGVFSAKKGVKKGVFLGQKRDQNSKNRGKMARRGGLFGPPGFRPPRGSKKYPLKMLKK